MKTANLLCLAVAIPVLAASPEGFALWKSDDLQAYTRSLAPKINEAKSAVANLGDYGNHRTLVNHREGNGEVEVHANWVDVMIMQTGEASVLIGGTLQNPKTTGPGEVRGDSATGGEKYKLAPGDVVHIPAGVPHQILIEPGKQVTYFAVKVPAKNPSGEVKDFAIWKAPDLKAYEKTLAPKVVSNHMLGAPLADYGNHRMQMTFRDGTGEAGAHANWSDILEIVAGAATLQVGGVMKDAKLQAGGESRSMAIEGGEKVPVHPGDVLHIPAQVPHLFLVPAGTQMIYLELKIPMQ